MENTNANNNLDTQTDRSKTQVLRRQAGETLTDYTLRFLSVHLPEAVVRRPEPRKLTVEEQCEEMLKELLRDNVTDRRRSDRE